HRIPGAGAGCFTRRGRSLRVLDRSVGNSKVAPRLLQVRESSDPFIEIDDSVGKGARRYVVLEVLVERGSLLFLFLFLFVLKEGLPDRVLEQGGLPPQKLFARWSSREVQ